MVRPLGKSVDGDCRDSGELFWQLDPASWGAQFSTVAVIDKNAALGRRMRSTSYGVARILRRVNEAEGMASSTLSDTHE